MTVTFIVIMLVGAWLYVQLSNARTMDFDDPPEWAKDEFEEGVKFAASGEWIDEMHS